MDLPADVTRRTLLTFAAAALTAAAFFVSFGLHPIWWLVWLAPLPVLLVVPGLRGWSAFAVAFAARAVAGLNLWNYARHEIHLPLAIAVAMVVVPAVFFSVAVMVYRGLLRKGSAWLAMIGFPAALVAYEYLISLSQGTFGNTGYTQLRNLPVVQLAAFGGLWAIGFAVYLFSAA